MTTKPRAAAVRFIELQLDHGFPKKAGDCYHYGRQELRELMDYIYGGPPAKPDELLLPNRPVPKVKR